MNNQLFIYDCLTAKLWSSDGVFMTIGSGEKSTFRLPMQGENGGSFTQRNGSCRFFPHGHIEKYSLNGVIMNSDVVIRPETMYLFVLDCGCFVCWYGDAVNKPAFEQYDPNVWFLYNTENHEWYGPYSLNDLPQIAQEFPPEVLVTFQGLENCAFYLKDMLAVAVFASRLEKRSAGITAADAGAAELLCPNCWEKFRAGQELAIAVHPDLRGDSILGADAMLRFKPMERNWQGLSIDAKGSPCPEYACPHCHTKLPPFFTGTQQHLLSLVGVPAAGKSYFLAALVRELELEFSRDFGMPFRDADPIANEPLNDMRMRLFSAKSPQEAHIGKTQLQGRLYHKVWRHGVMANMPRPFIYNLNKGGDTHSIVLYDNAGEDFQPGGGSELNPGGHHLEVADAILFLFDPTANPGFRKLLVDNKDPQLKRNLYPPGRQALLLAESEMRMRTQLNIAPGNKLDVPLALIIGKCDTWMHLLGPEPLLPATRNGMFMPELIHANSARLRQFIFNIAPHICTNAEAISSNVRYFAASAFGESPIEFTDADSGSTLIGPASGKVHPFRVTDAALWALSCVAPSLLPCAQTS